MTRPVVAAVGTTHPFAAAGLLLDLVAIRALGAQPVAIVAGVSAQNARHVLARAPVDAATIAAQFEALASVTVGAFCVGALLDAASVHAVAAGLGRFPGVPVICDPVIAASGGDRLADDETVAALREVLFARCTLLTPNLAEAEVLTGAPVGDLVAMRAAVPSLLGLGSAAVLLKGGHLDGDACDLLAEPSGIRELRAARIPHDLRGTGSLLASAIAVRCAFGDALPVAIERAREFVRERIECGAEFAGMRIAFYGES
ncbi:MAG TPA: bifunctional hydroxymethylpyrimidine kinase/phosphomethylpyrimidine kinase [Candidatus Lustribacter sp.]|nr:bifunctional hydroxymethylpyrimidine kinase/phosphomethylpyrimidine kinase [Candidatus Lustribacter sp.]